MPGLEGEKAPDFNLQGSDGKTHSLRDYAGKTLVIYFYPKDNTSGCTKEACGFRDRYPQMQQMEVALIGVSRDSLTSHDKFIDKFGLPFTLLSDPETKMMQDYGAFGEKRMYGKKVQGTIRSTVVIGPDGKVRRHWPTVKNAENHPQEVLEFLKSDQPHAP
ncbi:MAG TPA: peroxiredoxin [Desulfuromonadales bacterium]|nr:peroxiredoxin [Desulfuromonadales bacterium]